jgi:hypothetical protein
VPVPDSKIGALLRRAGTFGLFVDLIHVAVEPTFDPSLRPSLPWGAREKFPLHAWDQLRTAYRFARAGVTAEPRPRRLGA